MAGIYINSVYLLTVINLGKIDEHIIMLNQPIAPPEIKTNLISHSPGLTNMVKNAQWMAITPSMNAEGKRLGVLTETVLEAQREAQDAQREAAVREVAAATVLQQTQISPNH